LVLVFGSWSLERVLWKKDDGAKKKRLKEKGWEVYESRTPWSHALV
jgi:hypothetical protein